MVTSTKSKRRRRAQLDELPRWFDVSQPIDVPGATGIQAKILDAARRCYLQYGAPKLNLIDVARVAGVSRASVYKYYMNRSELLEQVTTFGRDTFVDDLTEAMVEDEPLEDQIVAAAFLVLRYYPRQVGYPAPRDVLHTNYEATVLTSGSGPLLAALIDVILPRLKTAKERGEIRGDLNLNHGAEWVARQLLSLVAQPAVTFDDTDAAAVERFVRPFFTMGLR